MRRWLKRLLLILLVLTLGLVGLVAYLLGSESGLMNLIAVAEKITDQSLQVEQASGNLSGPLQLQGLSYTSDGLHVELQQVSLDWSPGALLERRVLIHDLQVNGLKVRDDSVPEESTEPFRLPEQWQLPVGIRVERAALNDFIYRSGETEFVLDQAALNARWNDQGIELAELNAQGPDFKAQGRAEAGPNINAPLHAELDWQYALQEVGLLQGKTRLSGVLQDLRLSHQQIGPYEASLEARIWQDDNAWQYTAAVTEAGPLPVPLPQDQRLALNIEGNLLEDVLKIVQMNLRIGDLPVRLDANGQVLLAGEATALQINATWQDLQWPLVTAKGVAPDVISPRGKVELSGPIDDLRLLLEAELPEGKINGEAVYATDQLDAQIGWTQLSWPAQQPSVMLKQGKVTASGVPGDLKLQASTLIEAADAPSAKLQAQASLAETRLLLDDIKLETLGGQIQAQGQIDWAKQTAGHLAIKGSELNPGLWQADWQGLLGMNAQVNFAIPETGPSVTVSEAVIEGELRGQPLRLLLDGDYTNDMAKLQQLLLTSGDSRMQASGSVMNLAAAPELALDWQLDSPDLGQLLPDAKGVVKGEGRVTGPLQRPQIAASLDAESLRWSDMTLARLTVNGNLNLSDNSEQTLQVTATDGVLAGNRLRQAQIKVSGGLQQLMVTAVVDSEYAKLDMASSGRLDMDALSWDGRIARLHVKPILSGYDAPDWSLRDSAAIMANRESLNLQRLCLDSGEASLCTQAQGGYAELMQTVELQQLDLDRFAGLIVMEGQLSGHALANAKIAYSPLQVDATAGIENIRFERGVGETRKLLLAGTLQTETRVDDRGLRSQAKLQLTDQGQIELDSQLDWSSGSRTDLTGSVAGEFDDLSFLAAFSPELIKSRGRLQGELKLSGTLENPQAQGAIKLDEGRLHLRAPGIVLRDLTASISGGSSGGLVLDMQAHSGEGQISMQGDIQLTPQVGFKAQIKGQNFLVFNTPEAVIQASPDLDIAMAGDRIDLKGEVVVPKADITPRDLAAEGAKTVSTDEVIIRSSEQAKKEKPLDIYTDVKVVLGDQVRVDGLGLKARLAGKIRVKDKPNTLTLAEGELRATEGTYKAYGQDLAIEKGRLLFNGGPVTDPALDVRATRKPEEGIVVGVQVRGPLRQPRFNTFSDPSMTQSEQLSWLVLGVPLDSASQGESLALTRAALALGLGRGENIGQKVGDKVGLDSVGFESQRRSDGADQAALVVGKYLTPKLFVSYGVGLFEPASTLRLRYRINDAFSVETESGTESGGDILYTRER